MGWILALVMLCATLLLTACGGGAPAEQSGDGGAQRAMTDIPETAVKVGEGDLANVEAKAAYEEGFGEQKRCTVTLVNGDEEKTFNGTVYVVFADEGGNELGQEKKTLTGLVPGKQMDLVFWTTLEATNELPEIYVDLSE